MSKIVCLFAVKMFDCMKFGSFASIGFPPISKSIDNAIHFDHGRKERDDPLSLSLSRLPTASKTSSGRSMTPLTGDILA